MVPNVLYEKRGSIIIITLTRPNVLNAINRHLKHELGESLYRFDTDKETHVAIITGAGTALCAGRD